MGGCGSNDEQTLNDEKKDQVEIKQCELYGSGLYNVVAMGTRDLILLDLRTAKEYKQNHIGGAINFDIHNKNIWRKKDDTIAGKLTRYVKDKLISTESIYLIYEQDSNQETMNTINQFFKETVIPMIETKCSWCKFHTIYYCALFQELKEKFGFIMTQEITEIDQDTKTDSEQALKEQPLKSGPLGIHGKHKVYPSCIIRDKLFLGNSICAKDGDTLKALNITHIVNVTSEVENYFENDGIKYLRFEIQDNPQIDIKQYFDEAIEFIDNALMDDNNKVFVHCQAGISRSGSVVIAYLMKKHAMIEFQKTWDFVKKRRPIVHPNHGFIKQLIQYQSTLK